jgi:hypothetical protein
MIENRRKEPEMREKVEPIFVKDMMQLWTWVLDEEPVDQILLTSKF